MDVRNNLQALQQILGIGSVNKGEAAKSTSLTQTGSDTANLDSDQTTMSSAAVHASQASALPDVRMDLVQSVQAAIAGNTYRVDSAAVASKLIAHMLGS